MVFIGLFTHALNKKEKLELSDYEAFATNTSRLLWLTTLAIASLALVTALLLPAQSIPLSAFSYFLLGPCLAGVGIYRGKKWDRQYL